MKRYDLLVDGQTRVDLLEDDIQPLFRDGRIGRETPCRIAGSGRWKTIDDVLPLLKYSFSLPATVPARAVAAAYAPDPVRITNVWIERDDEGRPALTTSLKAGWICFGIGAAAAWIFPPAYVFYSVALILAIVAMCTRQVSRGLILLLTSFVGMGTSVFISMFLVGTLVLGTVGAAVKKAKMPTKTNAALQQSFSQLNQPITRPPLEQRSPQAILDEVAREERRQRRTRQLGAQVSSADREHLNQLRDAHDKALQRAR